MRKIKNKVYDKLSDELEEYLAEEFGITFDADKGREIMTIILNNLGIEKE